MADKKIPLQQASCLVRRLEGVADLRRLEGDHDEAGVIDAAVAVLKAISPPVQVPTVEEKSQDWAGMDGATAWHLINRHADGWADVAKMMVEWLAANTPPAAQRQWVGLRSEQYVDIARAISPTTVMGMKSLIPVWVVAYARAIEAKLKEKNA